MARKQHDTTKRRRRALVWATGDAQRLGMTLGVLTLSVGGIATLLTSAVLNDTKNVTGNTFSTTGVTLGVNPTTAAITMSGMNAGDVVTSPITVSNTNTAQFRYAMVSTTDATDNNVLAARLQLQVKTGISAANCTTANFTSTGTSVYGPGVLGSTAGTKVIGDPAQGAQTGDRVLAGSTNEVLCLQVKLPTDANDNTYAGKTTTATFVFNAEQTAGNP